MLKDKINYLILYVFVHTTFLYFILYLSFLHK